MKSYRNYLWIAAAAMLAACSNDVALRDNVQTQTEAPKAIGFNSYSLKATRGDATVKTNLEYYHSTFAVYGTKQSNNDETDIQYVFGAAPTETVLTPDGVTCTYKTAADAVLGDWKYENPRYWDKQATYDFIAYAPVSANNPIRYSYAEVGAQVGDDGGEFVTIDPYTLKGTNLQATATIAEIVKGFTGTADLDLMISAPNAQQDLNTAGTAYKAHDEYVDLIFRHILAKLNVTFAKAAVLDNATVTIKSVKIEGFHSTGSYQESNYAVSSDSKTSGWVATTPEEEATPYVLAYSNTEGQALNKSNEEPYFFIESLVIPQTIDADNKVILTAKYTIKSGTYSEDYTYKLDLHSVAALNEFFDGYNYTLKFTIQPDVIKFDASVTRWDDQNGVAKTID